MPLNIEVTEGASKGVSIVVDGVSGAALTAAAQAIAAQQAAETAQGNAETAEAGAVAAKDAAELAAVPDLAEILMPSGLPIPSGWYDTGQRLLSGVSERAIVAKNPVATLFSDGEAGVWYDPSDLSTLFQDTAGTLPVTADGDPVGLILDKSGNDNHATQITAAARPVLRQTVEGVYYLEFDGVDDHFLIGDLGFTPSGGFVVAGALSLASSGRILNVAMTNFAIDATISSSRNEYGRTLLNPDPTGSLANPWGPPSDGTGPLQVPHVYGEYILGSEAVKEVNGVDYRVSGGGIATPLDDMALGARSDGSIAIEMDFYGFLIRENNVSNFSPLRNYMASLAGVIL